MSASGGALRGAQAIAIALLVLELQAVYRLDLDQDFLPALGVEKDINAPPSTDAHMVVALGADVHVALDIGAIQHRIALDAFLPQSFGHTGAFFTVAAAHARGQNLAYPAHCKPRSKAGAIINAPRGN
jgi:hypothetical protein